MIVAICGFAVLCGAVNMKIAAGKQRDPLLWALVGLLFNVVGLLVAIVMPRHQEKPAPEMRAERPAAGRGAKAAVA
jgi:hypothetical protein